MKPSRRSGSFGGHRSGAATFRRTSAVVSLVALVVTTSASVVDAQPPQPVAGDSAPVPSSDEPPAATDALPGEARTGVPAELDSSAQTDEVAGEPPANDALDAISEMSLEQLLDLEIRVSAASLFDETSFDAGATVDVVTADDWERRGARRTLDAIANQPATAQYPAVFGGTAVAVRGYASNGSVRGLALLLDGVPLNDVVYASALNFASNVELPALSRIEVVRGPGSAIYGTDAFHGVLAYRSFSSARDERTAGVELGTDLFYRGFARMSQGIGEALRLNVAVGTSGLPDQARSYAYTDPMTGTEARAERALANRSVHGFASLDVAPRGSRWDGSASVHVNHAAAVGAPGYGRASDARSLLANRDVSSSNTELTVGRAQVGVTLPRRMRAEALAYFWYQDVFTRGPTTVPTSTGPTVADTDTSFDESRSGGRLSLRQEMGEGHRTQWVAGYEYSRARLYDGGIQTITDPQNDITFRSTSFVGDPFTRNIHSLFLSAQSRFLHDVVRIHYGGRVDHYSDFGFQVTPRLGVVVAPVERLALKALYGRAFRAPSVLEIRGEGADIGSNDGLRPEIIDTFELVALYQAPKFRVQLTGFASIWREGIILVPVVHPSYSTTYANAGQNHSLGAEASASFVLGAFRIDPSASYVRSRNDSAGVDYGAFPMFIANLGLGYDLPSARLQFYVFQRLQVGMTEGDPVSNASLRSQPNLAPYYRADVHVEWEAVREHLRLFVNVRNVFALTNTLPSLANAQYGAPSPGINASIGARGSF